MSSDSGHRRLVVINQAVNYLTIGLVNAFAKEFESVSLVTGSIHTQGESLDPAVEIRFINRWHERPAWKKAASYLIAMIRIWWLLHTRYRKHEVLFVSVPPMGYLLNLFVFNRFSMIIWDLYPDTFKIKGMTESHPVYRIWTWLNRRSFRRAFRLFTISETMAQAMTRYVPREKLLVHPIWSLFPENQRIPRVKNRFVDEHQLAGKFVVQYSGNIGLTHNVELLVDVAEKLQSNPLILFQIIGRGPRLPRIQELVHKKRLANVQLLPFQSDEMFPHSLSAANLGVVILDPRVSKGSVPSKAYNLMGFGIPSLYVAGADSELFQYARRFGHGECFAPYQIREIVDFIVRLANDPGWQKRLSECADAAARHFRPSNAEAFAKSYFSESI